MEGMLGSLVGVTTLAFQRAGFQRSALRGATVRPAPRQSPAPESIKSCPTPVRQRTPVSSSPAGVPASEGERVIEGARPAVLGTLPAAVRDRECRPADAERTARNGDVADNSFAGVEKCVAGGMTARAAGTERSS